MGILSSTVTDPNNLPGTDMLGNRENLAWSANTSYTGSQTIGNTVIDPRNPTTYGDRVPVTVKVALATVGTAGGVFAWANPTGVDILVGPVVLNVTTKSTGASTVDVGVAANGTTSNDTLIDGVDTGTATIRANTVKNAGTNGVSFVLCTSTQYITASQASGDVSGLVGFAYITYVRI